MVSAKDHQTFVDRVLFPALENSLPPHKLANFGLAFRTDGFQFREENGQFAFRGTFLEQAYVQDPCHAMRRIIRENQQELGCISDFIFVMQAIGIKLTIQVPE